MPGHRHQGADGGPQRDAGSKGTLSLHLGQHGVPGGVILGLLYETGGFSGVNTQRFQESLLTPQFPVNHAPVDAPVVHQSVKLFLRALGPLCADHSQGLGTGVGVVVRQTGQPQPLRLQAESQKRLGMAGQTLVDEPDGACHVAHLLPAGNICGQRIVQVQKSVVFGHMAGLHL